LNFLARAEPVIDELLLSVYDKSSRGSNKNVSNQKWVKAEKAKNSYPGTHHQRNTPQLHQRLVP
jgi:hypothetical protein